jgi:DNA repair exonuclease SbcCD ATPase subunit
MTETTEQLEPERKSPDVETQEAEVEEGQYSEAEEEEASSEESEVEGLAEEDDVDQSEKKPYYTIKYDGEEYEVTLDELKKGYQLQKDYTQKTQSLAEKRKELDTLAASLEEERQRYLQVKGQELNQYQSAMQAFDQIDWNALQYSDPMEYMRKVAEKQEVIRQHAEQQAQYQQALYRQQEQSNAQLRAHLEKEAAVLLEVFPEYGDPVKGPEFRNSISAYAESSGYTREEIASVADARDLIILNKARLWDEMQNLKSGIRDKKSAEQPSIRIKSSTPQGPNVRRMKQVEAIKAKARSSGKKEDAANAILSLMTRK